MVSEKLKKEAYRKYPPKTKFMSHFGTIDIVNDADEFTFDEFGEIYVLGEHQNRLIYNGKHWAEIIKD